MTLVESFAVVRELAAPYLRAVAQADLPEPVGVRERLARRRHAVGLAVSQDRLGLVEGRDAAAGHHRCRPAAVAERAANGRGERHVAAEGPALVRDDGRHALVSRAPGVRIDRLADLRLLGVLEPPALGDREIVDAPLGEAPTEPDRVVQSAAAFHDVVAEVADAHDVVAADPLADRGEGLQRQSHPVLARAAVAVGPRVQAREERRHRVGVRVVQLDAVEAGLAGAPGRFGEEGGKHPRQLADVVEVRVPDALTVAVVERLELAVVQHGLDRHSVGAHEELPHLAVGGAEPPPIVEPEGDLRPQRVGDGQIAAEELLGLGASSHRDEVDDLDEESRPSLAALAHRVDEPAQARNEAIVTDPEQRSAGHVPDAGGLDHEDAGLALGEARIPVEHLRRH